MKKVLITSAALMMAGQSAYATKARMQGLGQSQEIGSFYLQDTRNIFRNAAYAAELSDYVIAEWNDAAVNSSTSDGEGGIFQRNGNLSYGLYFGADIAERTQNSGKSTGSFTNTDDLIDLFVGGGDEMKWGARLNYGKNKPLSGVNTFYGVGLGVMTDKWEAYTNLSISNESEKNASTDKFEGELSYEVGFTYNIMEGTTAWVEYSSFGYDRTVSNAITTVENMRVNAGVGKEYKISKTSRVITDVSYFYNDQDSTASGTTTNTTTRGLDVNIGFEADANSWLTWRGSVKQDLTAELFGVIETANTNINGGATLNFGKLMVDGTIGFGSGKVGTNDFLGQVGVHYWF